METTTLTDRSMEIAQTINQQLGGPRFKAMTGAKDFGFIENGLQFKIGRNHRSINLVRITLDPSDTYTVQFCRTRKLKVGVVSEFSEVYCDMLQELFTAETGLYTHL